MDTRTEGPPLPLPSLSFFPSLSLRLVLLPSFIFFGPTEEEEEKKEKGHASETVRRSRIRPLKQVAHGSWAAKSICVCMENLSFQNVSDDIGDSSAGLECWRPGGSSGTL